MQNVFSKGILAAALIAGPAMAQGEAPAASPTTQAPNQDDGKLPRGVAAEALRQSRPRPTARQPKPPARTPRRGCA